MDSAESPTKTRNDETYNLLCQANEQFNNAEYERCLELLQQLEARGESSGPILRHNRAVVQYYNSGCTDHATLLKELEELDPDPVLATATSTTSESSNNSSSTGLSLKSSGSAVTVARYNKSVIYYHRHMHGTALKKLAPLVGRLEALEKRMAALVATLQLELLLVTNQLNRAEAFLDYLQNKLNIVGSMPTVGASTTSGGGGGGSGSGEEGATTTTATSTSTPATAVTIAASPATISESSTATTRTTTSSGDGGNLQLLQLLTHVLNRKPVVIPEDGTPQLAALKAHQYYIMKDFQMAAKQLMRINMECSQNGTCTPELSTCIANNMGVIHLRVRHYAIAAKFFQNALIFDKQLVANLRESTLATLSSARSCEILYNLGVAMLHLRRPKEAFQCFLVPVKLYHNNPRLWFRMAEACIMEHEEKLLEEERNAMPGGVSLSPSSSSKPYSSHSAAVPEPTLEFAALCLRSALTLTLHYKANFHIAPVSQAEDAAVTLEEKPTHWRQTEDNNFCNPSKPIALESLENMLAAIYAAHSYVSLRLCDYVTALEMAEELLKTERLSDAHKLLGHMYAGEALMIMDKPADARDHLEPTFVSTLNAFDLETRDWQLKSLDAAQNVVRYNLAVAMVLQSDFKAAKSLLATLTHQIVATKAMQLRRYIDVKLAPPPTGAPP